MLHFINFEHPRLTLFNLFLISFSTLSFASDPIKFSDPKHVIKMHDENWAEKAIKYKTKHKNVDLSISLDQQQYPYLKPIIEKFALQRNKTIAISDGTCGVSAGKLRRKEIDIGGFCCPPSKLDRLPGLSFHTLGIASLALIANNDVPINNVSLKQAKKIFSGELLSWSEISKKQTDILAISPVVRPHCDKRPGHWRLISADKSGFSKAKLRVGSIPNMLKKTSRIPGAVGYASLWMAEKFKHKEPVKFLSINSIHPRNNEALAKGDYPFYRTFSLTTWGEEAKPLAKELIAYLIQNINSTPDGNHTLIGVDILKKNGWAFESHELIAEPNKQLYRPI